jgi:hypothetical protein
MSDWSVDDAPELFFGGSLMFEVPSGGNAKGECQIVSSQPVNQITIANPGAYTLIIPESGTLPITVNYTGTYLVELSGLVFAGASTTKWEVVFNEGLSTQVIVGDSTDWELLSTLSSQEGVPFVFQQEATLIKGTYTVKVYGKAIAGASAPVIYGSGIGVLSTFRVICTKGA